MCALVQTYFPYYMPSPTLKSFKILNIKVTKENNKTKLNFKPI